MRIYGLPQPINGDELVTIRQEQDGHLVKCSMPLSELVSYLNLNWARSLPTTEPSSTGVIWNNSGVISIS